jgi:hypothetical protein
MSVYSRVGAAGAAAGLVVLVVATGVFANSPSLGPVCVSAKEGKAIVTPKGGACKAGYTLTEVAKEGREGPPATKLFAAVAAGGTLVRGSGVSSVEEFAPGNFVVTFDQTVSNCVPVATISGNVGEINTYTSGGPNVYVGTNNSNGGQAEMGFNVAVFC